MVTRILKTKLFTKGGCEVKDFDELPTADKNDLILVPEVIIPHVSSGEDIFFAGDVVKHTFLEARGGDIVEAEEIICLARAVEPIYIEYGGTVNIERIGNLFADIELVEKLPKNECISINDYNMLYQEIQMKDFIIHDVSERWFERYRNFDGTFADTRFSDIYETSLDIEYNAERYRLSLRLDREQLGTFGSIRDEEGEGRGISSEILVYIIRELTNEEKSTLQEFVNGLSELNLSDEVSLFVYDENNDELGKACFGKTMGDDLLYILNSQNHSSATENN